METLLAELRASEWRVGVHNDYTINGADRTFWLFTHPSGRFVKGEGPTDRSALEECTRQARQIMRALGDTWVPTQPAAAR